MAITKKGTTITSLHEWETQAGPKKKNQWAEGRSAMESARAWLKGEGKEIPPEILSALAGHRNFGPIQSWQAEPEAKLWFDNFAGEPRNTDLVVYVKDSHGWFLIAIEAKADETFGETISETFPLPWSVISKTIAQMVLHVLSNFQGNAWSTQKR
jgi:hypothetical protein